MTRRSSASLLKAVKDSGRTTGVLVTETDQKRISMLARWYSLSPEHIARAELDEYLWNPDLNPYLGDTERVAFASRVYAVKRRLARLARVEEVGPVSGPLVGGGRFDFNDSTWFATAYGVTAAELPWRLRPEINPQFVRHAWFAADAGLQIERAGFSVLSERELATGVRVNGDEVGFDLNSQYVNPNTGAITNKKPDVAVLSRTSERFVAVEVENDKNRSMRVYMDKLKAYDANPNVAAVWYLCSSQATGNRVGQAANKVFGSQSGFPLRIRIVEPRNGWMGIPNFTPEHPLFKELEALG